MKINKEIRQLSREMLRASFTDGQLDPGRIAALVDSRPSQLVRAPITLLANTTALDSIHAQCSPITGTLPAR